MTLGAELVDDRSQRLGMFVGVAGFDWLTDGQAEPVNAALAAIAAGAVIVVARRWMKRHRKN